MTGGENIEHRQMNKISKGQGHSSIPPDPPRVGGHGVLEQKIVSVTTHHTMHAQVGKRQNSGGTVWPSIASKISIQWAKRKCLTARHINPCTPSSPLACILHNLQLAHLESECNTYDLDVLNLNLVPQHRKTFSQHDGHDQSVVHVSVTAWEWMLGDGRWACVPDTTSHAQRPDIAWIRASVRRSHRAPHRW